MIRKVELTVRLLVNFPTWYRPVGRCAWEYCHEKGFLFEESGALFWPVFIIFTSIRVWRKVWDFNEPRLRRDQDNESVVVIPGRRDVNDVLTTPKYQPTGRWPTWKPDPTLIWSDARTKTWYPKGHHNCRKGILRQLNSLGSEWGSLFSRNLLLRI